MHPTPPEFDQLAAGLERVHALPHGPDRERAVLDLVDFLDGVDVDRLAAETTALRTGVERVNALPAGPERDRAVLDLKNALDTPPGGPVRGPAVCTCSPNDTTAVCAKHRLYTSDEQYWVAHDDGTVSSRWDGRRARIVYDDPIQQERRRRGQCIECGRDSRPLSPPYWTDERLPGPAIMYYRQERCLRCQKARESAIERARKVTARKTRGDAGLCTECGTGTPDPGNRQCPECLTRAQEAQRIQKGKRAKANLCSRCGRQEPAPGGRWCSPCRAARSAWHQSRKNGRSGS